MDDRFVIPGTRRRVGLDALIGLLLPTAGDVATGVGALALWVLAWRYRAPAPVMARMLRNVLVDVVVGSVPIAGDAFDALWRSNRRNLQLLEPYLEPEHAQRGWRARDYAMLAAGLLVGATLIVAPLVLLIWLIGSAFD